ncbi:MAG: EamA family transporter [Lachnospiraceae bacterium]|nr:EamA family transporter [Lachnospiraceae bacterium]
MIWISLTLVYGLLKGVREIVKKKSLEKSTVMEVLFFYTLFGFLFLLPSAPAAGGVSGGELFWIAVKSFLIFLAWIASFHAIKKIPISLYGILDLSRVLFATLLGVLVLRETLSPYQVVGLLLVATGLLLLKRKKASASEDVKMKYVLCAFASCILNAFSGLMDKILTKTVTPVQLQFWYMLFLVLFYGMYLLFSKTKVDWKNVWKNYWIWILSILFVVADRALFLANEMPESRITVMTLIKQSSCLVTILAGKFIFKEQNIRYKLFCAFIIILGIVIGVL